MLVSRRYERASLIVTSNKPFSAWGEIFGDDVVAAAMIDRLVHHAEILALKGDSDRLKERDLARPPAARTPKPPHDHPRHPRASAQNASTRHHFSPNAPARLRNRTLMAYSPSPDRLGRPGIPLSNERQSGPLFNRRERPNIRPALTQRWTVPAPAVRETLLIALRAAGCASGSSPKSARSRC
jgi:hypothetical protein